MGPTEPVGLGTPPHISCVITTDALFIAHMLPPAEQTGHATSRHTCVLSWISRHFRTNMVYKLKCSNFPSQPVWMCHETVTPEPAFFANTKFSQALPKYLCFVA